MVCVLNWLIDPHSIKECGQLILLGKSRSLRECVVDEHAEVHVVLGECDDVEELHEDGGVLGGDLVRQVLELDVVALEQPAEHALLFVPHVHVFRHVEPTLYVRYEEVVFVSSEILGVEDGDILGIALGVSGVSSVVILPGATFGECSPIPHLVEGIYLFRRHFHRFDDVLLEVIHFG